MTYTATVQVTREEWEAIQASFSVDLREDIEGYDEEIIDKYDFRVGTNPNTFLFHFADGTRIYCDWFVEEFGGVIRWFDENELESLDESSYDLQFNTKFEASNEDEYICHFELINE